VQRAPSADALRHPRRMSRRGDDRRLIPER
jgi:hypothetical protein